MAVKKKPSDEAHQDQAEKSVTDRFRDVVERIEPLIDKVNALYNQYFIGVEKRPPVELRRQLDTLMTELTQMPKITATHRFRFGSIQARFISHKDRWDRVLRDMELGRK